MKVLMFSIYSPTPLFETEIELALKYKAEGAAVRMIQCAGALRTCHWNPTHNGVFCAYCRSRFASGMEFLGSRGALPEIGRFPSLPARGYDLPKEFKDIRELMDYRWDGERIGLCVASSAISKNNRDHRLDTKKFAREINCELITAVHVYESLKKEIQDFKPDRVELFNGRISTHAPAILLCKKYSLEYFTYEVAGSLNKYLHRHNATPHSIAAAREEIDDLWAQGGEDKENKAKTWFGQRRGGVDQGIISFTKDQKAGLLPAGFDERKRNIVIFNSTIEEYAAVDGWENPIYPQDESSGVAAILDSFRDRPEFHFYLRVHPHLKKTPSATNSQMRDIERIARDYRNVTVIWPEEVVHSYALIDACEKVVTFGSTIGVEAAYWGKPSILAGRALYEHLDCVQRPSSHAELVGMLEDPSPPQPRRVSALPYGYREMSYGVPYEYFEQTSVSSGNFDGVSIRARPSVARLWKAQQFLDRTANYAKRRLDIIRSGKR